MGWTSHKLPHNPQWKLWTRGGTCGVFIRHENRLEEIKIPPSLLRMLVAEDVRNHKMDFYKSATDDAVLFLPPCQEELEEEA